jgi:hypothetical protein
MIGPIDSYRYEIDDLLAILHLEFMRELQYLMAFFPVLIVLAWCAALILVGLSTQ